MLLKQLKNASYFDAIEASYIVSRTLLYYNSEIPSYFIEKENPNIITMVYNIFEDIEKDSNISIKEMSYSMKLKYIKTIREISSSKKTIKISKEKALNLLKELNNIKLDFF